MSFTTNSNKTKLESDVFELDDLLRVSISNRWTSRENLKEKIDDIAKDILLIKLRNKKNFGNKILKLALELSNIPRFLC